MARAPIVTPRADDFPRWYQDVIAKAELAQNGPVRGTMVIRPYGYALWEHMQRAMDDRIKAAGARNAYFPLFIPESYMHREAEHVEGFSPELAVVTHAGGKQLEEPIVVRPTSETVIGQSMSDWVHSHRDLPLLVNQWANVVRWELRPRLFLRTSEFLWQEGHTAHGSEADARAYARLILHDVYADFIRTELAVPVLAGRKTRRERFAGATNTMTLESMMGDGKALQMGTSHELGQNFARAFDIGFTGADQTRQLCWTTSWGSSTRMVGGLIMTHGDDAGLRVPPRIADPQAVVLVVKDAPEVAEASTRLTAALRSAGVRVELDDRTDTSFGRRVTDVELKGVPVRIEVGPRDVADGVVTMVRRIDGGREQLSVEGDAVVIAVTSGLDDGQRTLYEQAQSYTDAHTVELDSAEPDAVVEATATGWARLPWSKLGDDGEAALAGRGVTVRCLVRADGSVPDSDTEDGLVAVVGRAY